MYDSSSNSDQYDSIEKEVIINDGLDHSKTFKYLGTMLLTCWYQLYSIYTDQR